MEEIAKCPICKEAPIACDHHYRYNYEKSYACCEVEIYRLELWNQYAAAMDAERRLAKVEKEKKDLIEIIDALLEYIDAIPSDVAAKFPTMPGISRDWIEEVLQKGLP